MKRWCIVLALSTGCAAGSATRSTADVAPPAPPEPGVAYERILPTFTVTPRALVILDPRTTVDLVDRPVVTELASLVDRYKAIAEHHGEAVARVDYAAMLWLDGRARRAYEEVTEAQSLFAGVGDVSGLAHTYEWLGFIFLESGEVERAAEHFGVAYRLFGSIENAEAQARVLAYAETDG